MEQNCRSDWPQFLCVVGNCGSTISMVMWFAVLLPQLVRNYLRKSVEGLNVLWALANFTASLCNLFFVLRLSLPVQVQVMAIYMPLLEFTMLCQFFLFLKATTKRKFIAAGCCLVVWSAVILVDVFFSSSASGSLEWAAVALWSVETFPQLYTNLRLKSTTGQSATSVLVTCVGKTTDSLTAYLLRMPTQTRVLAYFSATSAWFNALHVFVFFVHSQPRAVTLLSTHHDDKGYTSISDNSNGGCVNHGSYSATEKAPDGEQKIGSFLSRLCLLSGHLDELIVALLSRSKLARSCVCCALCIEICLVLCAAVLCIWKWWVIALPSFSITVIASFYIYLGRQEL